MFVCASFVELATLITNRDDHVWKKMDSFSLLLFFGYKNPFLASMPNRVHRYESVTHPVPFKNRMRKILSEDSSCPNIKIRVLAAKVKKPRANEEF